MKPLVILVTVFCVFESLEGVGWDDYWNDDYDETKNCKEEKTIAKLFSESPDYCAMQTKGKKRESPWKILKRFVPIGTKEMQWENCKKDLSAKLVKKCMPRSIKKVSKP